MGQRKRHKRGAQLGDRGRLRCTSTSSGPCCCIKRQRARWQGSGRCAAWLAADWGQQVDSSPGAVSACVLLAQATLGGLKWKYVGLKGWKAGSRGGSGQLGRQRCSWQQECCAPYSAGSTAAMCAWRPLNANPAAHPPATAPGAGPRCCSPAAWPAGSRSRGLTAPVGGAEGGQAINQTARVPAGRGYSAGEQHEQHTTGLPTSAAQPAAQLQSHIIVATTLPNHPATAPPSTPQPAPPWASGAASSAAAPGSWSPSWSCTRLRAGGRGAAARVSWGAACRQETGRHPRYPGGSSRPPVKRVGLRQPAASRMCTTVLTERLPTSAASWTRQKRPHPPTAAGHQILPRVAAALALRHHVVCSQDSMGKVCGRGQPQRANANLT